VHRLKSGGIVGLAGDGDHALALLAWLDSEREQEKYPAAQKDNDTSALVIEPDGRVLSFGKTAHPQPVEDKVYAFGHGRDFALAAMHCGKTAREAVEIACLLDVYCGNGIDALTLR
jgi:ATP-dependent protease HslVU (ClpYQ) peptidase subunit